MKDLPIGISSLKTIIESGMVYVDKTMFAEELAMAPPLFITKVGALMFTGVTSIV